VRSALPPRAHTAAMAAESLVAVDFEGRSLQLSAERGLDGILREAEAKFGLNAKSFDLFDGHGKVDTEAAWRRAAHMSGQGSGRLLLRERPEWKKIREMDAQMAALSREQACHMAALEGRILAHVDASLAELREGLHTLMGSTLPLTESLALEQMELKAMLPVVQSLAIERRASVPLLQSLALEQMELKERVEQILRDMPPGALMASAASEAEPLAASKPSVSEKLPLEGGKLEELQRSFGRLSDALEAASDSQSQLQEKVRTLGDEVLELKERCVLEPDSQHNRAAAWTSTGAVHEQPKEALKCDSYSLWAQSLELSADFAYSSKRRSAKVVAPPLQSWQLPRGEGPTAPFVRWPLPRQLDRASACRSLPQLPAR